MGTTLDDWGGWLVFIGTYDDNTKVYKIKCESIPEFNFDDPSATFIDYTDDGHYGFGLGTRIREVILKDIWFTTEARFKEFHAFLNEAQDAGTLKIRLQIKSNAASPVTSYAGNTTYIDGYYFDWDGGDHYTLPVLWQKPRGVKKLFRGDAAPFTILQIKLRQRAALEAW